MDTRAEEEESSAVHFDSIQLARQLNLPLVADDRVCQTIVYSRRPDSVDSAFGTDIALGMLHAANLITSQAHGADLLKLIRWRYRFLLFEGKQLVEMAFNSVHALPGPELTDIACYVHECMRDPGLFCGQEPATLPMPMALKYFRAWEEVCLDFIVELFDDNRFNSSQRESLATWCVDVLLPSLPKGLQSGPIGCNFGLTFPTGILLSATIRFAQIKKPSGK